MPLPKLIRDAKVIRLGIGDVTKPLPEACTLAMIRAVVEEMGDRATFKGYVVQSRATPGYEKIGGSRLPSAMGVRLTDYKEIFRLRRL